MRESLTLVAMLLASMVGCASSLQITDYPAETVSFVDGQQTVGRTHMVAPNSGGVSDSPNFAKPTIPEPPADDVPINRQLPSQPPTVHSPTVQSPTVQYLSPVGNERDPRFDEDLSTLTFQPPVEPLNQNPWLDPYQTSRNLFDDVLSDHANYYSRRNLGMLAVGVGVAAVMANTRLDETIQRNYQENIRDLNTDEYSEALHTPNVLGNGYIMIPAFCGAALVGSWYDDTPIGQDSSEWGQRCLRTILVGGPPMLAMQLVTGASRPGESDNGSVWSPFQDNNGVSGHSFLGAVPFISAAKMTDDRFWKAAFYAGSTLAGLSRINDDNHYTSQVMLGWWMAYVAATAVDNTQQANKSLTVFPLPMADGFGAGLEYRW